MGYFYSDEELAHHGIKGQKWGVRRFETEGGHLTAAGKARYDGKVSAKEKNAFSAKAAGYRALSKLHSINAATSPTSGGRKLAAAAKRTADREAEKAQKEANAKRDAHKSERIDSKFEKKISKNEAAKEKMLNRREHAREKIEKKNLDADKKEAKLKDFDEGTRMVKAGYEKYSKVLKNYKDAKLNSISDSSIKNEDAYITSKKEYMNQKFSDLMYGSDYTVLKYATKSSKN